MTPQEGPPPPLEVGQGGGPARPSLPVESPQADELCHTYTIPVTGTSTVDLSLVIGTAEFTLEGDTEGATSDTLMICESVDGA